MATESPAAQLITVEIEYPEFATLLNDIRDFDWKLINKLRKEDLARVASTGFRFRTKGKESQQKELASFLIEHPSVAHRTATEANNKASNQTRKTETKEEKDNSSRRRRRHLHSKRVRQ